MDLQLKTYCKDDKKRKEKSADIKRNKCVQNPNRHVRDRTPVF